MKNVKYFLIVLLLPLLFSCENREDYHSREYFTYFDTFTTFSSYENLTDDEFDKLSNLFESEYEKWNNMLDIYNPYKGEVNLYTINHSNGEWVSVTDEMLDFLLYIKELPKLTNFKCDPSYGVLFSLWEDVRNNKRDFPNIEELRESSLSSGIEKLEIDRENKRVKVDGIILDVGSVGKGYAVEECAKTLVEKGYDSFVINAGGNLKLVGNKKNGDGWNVGIKDPDGGVKLHLALKNTSVVTSGGYERYTEHNGKKYSHIIDLDTLYSATYFSSVTIITPSSSLGDVLSTTLSTLSYENGVKFLSSFDNIDCIWIFPDGSVKYTEGVEKYIRK